MRSQVWLITCCLPLSLFCQVAIEGPWTIEGGVSTNNAFKTSSSYNMRYISPRFKWSETEWSEEEQKHPEEFRNTRLMVEVIYAPPLKVLCTGFNVQSRLLRYKKLLSMELYGGFKLFVVPGPDFERIPYLKDGRIWYLNMGLLFQVDLGIVAPFADIGGDGIITVGTEVNFHKIYRKPKRRYKLKLKNT